MMTVSVCLSVREHISGTTSPIFTRFYACYLCPWLGPFSVGVEIRYVLPFLWITSYLHIMGHIQGCRCNTGTDNQPACWCSLAARPG